MLHILTSDILPVFAMLALGFVMGRAGTASQDEARAVNRVAFLTLQPPLIFLLLTGLDLSALRPDAVLLYGCSEALAFAATVLIARHVFGRDLAEAWLLGMAVVFVNSLLYVWPISVLIYGESGAEPVAAIVAMDSALAFSFFIVSTELIAGRGRPGSAARRLARNPVLITIPLALAINLAAVPIPVPIETAGRFAGAAAAPMTLFAMGVVLSSHGVRPSPTVAAVATLKLFAFPLLVWAGFAVLAPDNPWQGRFVLTAAGPSGAMAFSLALLHGIRTDAIAPVIIWTSVLSLFSLAWLA